jgi:hypothetical protein
MRRAIALCAFLAVSHTALAQSAGPPRFFIGAGLYIASDDYSNRMGRVDFADEDPSVISVEGGVRVAPRVSIGAEFLKQHTLEDVALSRSAQTHGEQRENVLVGTVRARLAGGSDVALDVVGGAGAVLQHHEERVNSCAITCVMSSRTKTNWGPAVSAGVDVPIRLAHLVIAPTMRVYYLARGEPADRSWVFQWHSATRLAAGVSVRVAW